MDLLQSRGEVTPEHLSEIETLSKGELVELLVESNRHWYQLLDGLEAAHKQDMKQLEEQLRTEFDLALSTTLESEKNQLGLLSGKLVSLGETLNDGIKKTKSNSEILSGLKIVLEKSMSGRLVNR